MRKNIKHSVYNGLVGIKILRISDEAIGKLCRNFGIEENEVGLLRRALSRMSVMDAEFVEQYLSSGLTKTAMIQKYATEMKITKGQAGRELGNKLIEFQDKLRFQYALEDFKTKTDSELHEKVFRYNIHSIKSFDGNLRSIGIEYVLGFNAKHGTTMEAVNAKGIHTLGDLVDCSDRRIKSMNLRDATLARVVLLRRAFKKYDACCARGDLTAGLPKTAVMPK